MVKSGFFYVRGERIVHFLLAAPIQKTKRKLLALQVQKARRASLIISVLQRTIMAAARKAWNDAMKATAGAAIPSHLRKPTKRRSDRHKKSDRRQKARKSTTKNDDEDEFSIAVWIDSLEGVDPNVVQDDDEEYDELEELGDKKQKSRGRKKKKQAGAMPKRFLPRSLGSILMEEVAREDSVAKQFINSHVKTTNPLPKRKFCPVTGVPGIYTDPKTGLPYSGFRSLDQIQERQPPWMSLGGAASYLEAVKSIQESEY